MTKAEINALKRTFNKTFEDESAEKATNNTKRQKTEATDNTKKVKTDSETTPVEQADEEGFVGSPKQWFDGKLSFLF